MQVSIFTLKRAACRDITINKSLCFRKYKPAIPERKRIQNRNTTNVQVVGSNSNWNHTLLIYRVKCVNWQQNSNEIYTFRLPNICGTQNRVDESSKASSNRDQFRQPAAQITNALHNMRYTRTATDILILFIYLLLYNSISSIQTSSFRVRLGRRLTGRISHWMKYMYIHM